RAARGGGAAPRRGRAGARRGPPPPPIGALYLQGRAREGSFTAVDRERAELFARQLAPLADRLVARRSDRAAVDATREVRSRFHCPEILGHSLAPARVLAEASPLAPLAPHLPTPPPH